MRYRRNRIAGGTYFFTVVTRDRAPLLTTDEARTLLSRAFQQVRRRHPFQVDAMVLLPDHLHCIWTLPEHDDDFSVRWRLIKRWVSHHASARLIARRPHGRGSPLWQGRFWEHTIRGATEYRHMADYVHYNPVKHGYVRRAADWPYSTFARFCAEGRYSADWGDRDAGT